MDPPKPRMTDYEKRLIQESNKNPYSNALLYMTMATNKKNISE